MAVKLNGNGTSKDSEWKPPPGHLGNLTAEQQDALDRLKKELVEMGKFDESRMDDTLLLRFHRSEFHVRY